MGTSADLQLNGFGPMMLKENKNKLQLEKGIQPAGGNPGTVTVCGTEGCESAQVVVE